MEQPRKRIRLLIWIAISVLALSFAVGAYISEEFPAAPNDTFTIALIPDTQHYKNIRPDDEKPVANPVFESYVNWIVKNRIRQRIACVTHVGDIVDENTPVQWEVARRLMDRIHGKIPYGISVGNHDMVSSGDSSLFQRFFPAERYSEFEWYGGYFKTKQKRKGESGNNANSFQLFTVQGLDFVIVHLECNAPDNVLAWADDILNEHRDRRAIITTHMYLGPLDRPKKPEDYFDAPKGRMTWKKCHGKRGNSPQQMWDKSFRKHANLFMICCGDQSRSQAMHTASVGDHGNRVHELLADYGVHGFRLMRFIPGSDRIEVRTWNPNTSKLCSGTDFVPDRSEHQFDLTYLMSE